MTVVSLQCAPGVNAVTAALASAGLGHSCFSNELLIALATAFPYEISKSL